MNKIGLFFLPYTVYSALNGMAYSPKALGHPMPTDERSATELRLNELTARLRAYEQYLAIQAGIFADQARETERNNIKKRLKKIEKLQKALQANLQGKKLTTYRQTQLITFEQLTSERELLQDKLQALDESDL